jgi:hypothetical protein
LVGLTVINRCIKHHPWGEALRFCSILDGIPKLYLVIRCLRDVVRRNDVDIHIPLIGQREAAEVELEEELAFAWTRSDAGLRSSQVFENACFWGKECSSALETVHAKATGIVLDKANKALCSRLAGGCKSITTPWSLDNGNRPRVVEGVGAVDEEEVVVLPQG